MKKLLATGKTDLLQFVSSRTRRPFAAYLVRQPDGKIGFEFQARKDGAGKPLRGGRGAAALRVLGKHPKDKQPVELHAGRYGPYVKHGGVNATLPDRDQVDALTLDEAVALLAEKSGKGASTRRAKTTKSSRSTRQREHPAGDKRQAPSQAAADGESIAAGRDAQARDLNALAEFRITLVGSRYFGAATLARLLEEGVDIARVLVPAADDRLALAAASAGLEVKVLDDPKLVPADAIAEGTDLIVAAHSHARVSNEALARSRLGGIGFHPSLLPRHRGIAAVEWTIREADSIAGGSIYHLADRMDAGAIAAQDWCFVKKGETARELWERALAPMGLALIARVIRHAKEHGTIPAKPQDEQFATQAPLIRDGA